MAYAGIKARVYDGQGSKYSKITTYDQSDSCTSVTNEFFKEAHVEPKKLETIGPVSFCAYGNQAPEAHEKWETPGRIKTRYRHFGGALGYLSRGSRPDITFFVNFLLRFVDKWNMDKDENLMWLFSYLY